MRLFVPAALTILAALGGCASTKVETTGSPLMEPMCRAGAPAISTTVYWGTQWRPDQKEPSLREAAALRGIQDFLTRTSCLAVTGIHRLPAGDALPSNEDLMRLAMTSSARPERVVLIVVRELGPRLTIGVPVLVAGGTEVLIDVRVLSPQNAVPMGSTSTLWRHGGAFYIKGVKSLDQDMSAALSATLMPQVVAK